jgi:hypothetical protein
MLFFLYNRGLKDYHDCQEFVKKGAFALDLFGHVICRFLGQTL